MLMIPIDRSTTCSPFDHHSSIAAICKQSIAPVAQLRPASSTNPSISRSSRQSRKLATSVAKPLLLLSRAQLRCFGMQSASAVAAVAAGANPVAMAMSVRCEVGKSSVWGASRVKLLRPNGCGSARSACTITEGAKLPDASLSYFDNEGNVHSVKVSDLTRAKKVVLFAVPGAFTPTCSTQHLPGFIAKAEELRNAGVDVLACISVNDAFVMRAWGEQQNVGDKVLLLSDGLCSFTKALGATVDLSDKPVGLGVRSRRYSMLVDDGVVKALNMEEGGAFTTSSAEEILKQLQKPKAAPPVDCSAGHNVL